MYFRDTDGVILVFDVTDKESFENVRDLWIKEVKERAPENVQIAFVGNKTDLNGKEQVSLQEANELALANSTIVRFVSAKKNQGLNEVF
jgi:small GTP-binding protein